MKQDHTAHRPALAAIAAVLAFSSTPLFAQTAAPPVAVVPTLPSTAPAAPAPTAPPAAATPAAGQPVMAAPSPVVQPIPATPAPVEATEAAAPAARAERPAPRIERAQPARAEANRAVAAEAPATAPAPMTPVAQTPVATPTPPEQRIAQAQNEPAPPPAATASATQVNDGTGEAIAWALGAGIVVLGGIGAFAALRRRRPNDAEIAQTYETAEVVDTPAQTVAYAPVTATAPVEAEPLYRTPKLSPAAPVGSLDQMVAAAPSRENPFLTRKNRIRRAKFLMAQGGAPRSTVQPAVTVNATQPKPVVREAPIYDFGKTTPRGIRGLRPART